MLLLSHARFMFVHKLSQRRKCMEGCYHIEWLPELYKSALGRETGSTL